LSASTSPPDPASAPDPTSSRDTPVAAAVLVALIRGPGPTQMVLTRRRADLRSHAGEISFPGGRRDETDSDLAETALREAEEEIGLPRAKVEMLGTLPVTSTFVTNYLIHPFVATIPDALDWKLSPREVDEVLELGVEEVRAARTITTLTRRGFTFQTDAYILGEHMIWGATARIIEQLLERLQDDPGEPLRLTGAAEGG
jgi:8-oxo-dGTP pyrophosphatase MutT (NUDIX family)